MKMNMLFVIIFIIIALYLLTQPNFVEKLLDIPPFNVITFARNQYGYNNVKINYSKLFMNFIFILVLFGLSIGALLYFMNKSKTKSNQTGGTIDINDEFSLKKNYIMI
jgi:hypothetical protein